MFIIAGSLCFSTTGVVQALAPQGATPYILGALRMLAGGLCLLVWCALRGQLPRPGNWPLRQVIVSALALLGCHIFFFQGALLTGIAITTVLAVGSTPIFAALLGWLFLREKPTHSWYAATAVGLCGLILLNLGAQGDIRPLYLLLPLANGFCYALYMVCGRPLVERHPPETVMAVLCLLCGICMLPLFLYFPISWIASAKGLLSTFYLGALTCAAAFSFMLAGLKTTPTAAASTLALAEPLSAALIGIIFLGEPVGNTGVAGMMLILAGALILIFVKNKA